MQPSKKKLSNLVRFKQVKNFKIKASMSSIIMIFFFPIHHLSVEVLNHQIWFKFSDEDESLMMVQNMGTKTTYYIEVIYNTIWRRCVGVM